MDLRIFLPMHRIGIISDTHRLLRPEAIAALQGVEHIIHAGDIGWPAVIDELRRIAPVTAVRGNVDAGDWARNYPETAAVELFGAAFYVIHDIKNLDLDPRAAGFAAVICGHSHAARQEMKNGVLYFNPGSAGPRRFHLPVTVGILALGGLQVTGEIVMLDV
jgi:putative phosphoesterase